MKTEEDTVRFWLLQESHPILFEDFTSSSNYMYDKNMSIIRDSGIRYCETHTYGYKQGLIIESNPEKCIICNKIPGLLDLGEYILGCMSLNFKLINGKIITLINVHTQKYNGGGHDYSKEYFMSLKYRIIPFIEEIIKKNNGHLIILGGDFNMNENYWDIDNFKQKYSGAELFQYIKDLGFIDCMADKPKENRGTMVNGDDLINDYIFIYQNNNGKIIDCNVYQYEDINFTDHKYIELNITY
jgi:hypothetical protein